VKTAALIVHGGAWDVPDELYESCRLGAGRAVERGWKILASGGSALDACEQAIIELEEDPVFDAGIGSHLNRDGVAQLDAILMDGVSLKSGAVASVERIRNPIQLARLILQTSEHMLLTGYGAEQFAREHGFPLCDPSIFKIATELDRWTQRSAGSVRMGTVGAAAIDLQGNLAAGTSTGGTFYKYPGRVGDSPLVGCGCYADNAAAAVSSTGNGESIMKVVLSKAANDLVATGHSAQQAADAAVAILSRRTNGRGGLIVVDRNGGVGSAFTTKNLVRAFKTSDDPAVVIV
jgi:beta-aspartyl-peptidase (threonine type)